MATYHEHEKLHAIKDRSQACGEFYEWLQDAKGIDMVQHFRHETDEDGYRVWRDRDGNIIEDYRDPNGLDGLMRSSAETAKYRKMRDELGIDCRLVPDPGGPIEIPIRQSLQSLLAEFFGIDEDKLEAEKQQMLDECRKLHEKDQMHCQRCGVEISDADYDDNHGRCNECSGEE